MYIGDINGGLWCHGASKTSFCWEDYDHREILQYFWSDVMPELVPYGIIEGCISYQKYRII